MVVGGLHVCGGGDGVGGCRCVVRGGCGVPCGQLPSLLLCTA